MKTDEKSFLRREQVCQEPIRLRTIASKGTILAALSASYHRTNNRSNVKAREASMLLSIVVRAALRHFENVPVDLAFQASLVTVLGFLTPSPILEDLGQ